MLTSDPNESIPDSEDDEEEILKFPAVPQTVTSTISQFTVPNVPPKPVEETSPVTMFTIDKDRQPQPPPKGRVRPQPRKPRVASSSGDSIDSPATAGPSRLNNFDMDANARQERLLKLKGWKIHPRPPQGNSASTSVKHIIEVSSESEDEVSKSRSKPPISRKEKGKAVATAQKASSSALDTNPGVNRPQSSIPIADTSVLPPSDSPTSTRSIPSTPPSSVIVTSKKRSHNVVEDDDSSDYWPVVLDSGPSSPPEIKSPQPLQPKPSPPKAKINKNAKKQPDKPKKPRAKKTAKANADEEEAAKKNKSKPAPARKRNKTTESADSRTALYKSAEFIFDSSDDEIAIQSSSKPGTIQKTVPPSTDVSAPPTIPISAPPTIPISAPSTIPISQPPTVPISVPPTVLITTKPPVPDSRPADDEELAKLYKRAVGSSPSLDDSEDDELASQALRRRATSPSRNKESSQQGKRKRAETNSNDQEPREGDAKATSRGKKFTKIFSDSSSRDEVRGTEGSTFTNLAPTNTELAEEPRIEKARDDTNKENVSPAMPSTTSVPPTPSAARAPRSSARPRSSLPYMAPRKGSMSDLIRRASSKVNSPLASPAPTYSPFAKSSRSTLSKIAPLHVSRRTPPPPPPRPPQPKKTKKMLELEEKWEMELADTVEGWSCMAEEERAAMIRAKRDMELGYED